MVQKAFHGFPLPFQIPENGTTGQFLRKKAGGVLETEWVSAAAGSGDMLASAFDPDGIGMDVFGGGVRIATRNAIEGETVAADVDYIHTAGFAAVGDGGSALYKRVVSEPSHPGKVQSADGTWWEIASLELRPEMFGAVGDWNGTTGTDDFSSLSNCFATARALRRKILARAKRYYIADNSLDISGIEFEGVLKGYRNSEGTGIDGDGSTDVLVQSSVTTNLITPKLRNLRIRGAGGWGLKTTYTVHAHIEHVYVTDSVNGISLGDIAILGPLWGRVVNCNVDVTGIPFVIYGTSNTNANLVENCFFKGGLPSEVDGSSGFGATSNIFINTEFAGATVGLHLKRSRNTVIFNPYLESEGPSIKLSGARGVKLINPLFAVLRNDNPTGVNAFIWHESLTSSITIEGGHILINAGTEYNNLSLVYSAAPSSFTLKIPERPFTNISATGFIWLDSAISPALTEIGRVQTFTTSWTGSVSNPSLGNGTLEGRWTRAGEVMHVSINLTIGSTTTFGSGNWVFTMPAPANRNAVGTVWMRDQGTTFRLGTARIAAGSSNLVIYVDNNATLVGPDVPFTWANGDTLDITISFMV